MAKEDDEPQLPLSEEEAIAKQRKQFLLFAIAGILMLVIAFLAGRTVRGWVSDDDSAPLFSPVSIVEVIDDEI
ncbi:hypothetical protein [Flaviflexus massiliensis]|uniref:hypothetical protein n=1 Tax=Flaviflexus massiliensis TaxID=1522309 RepID=UPI0006D533D1|nr:hypothetical protein [Flaviflexus massiliensis]